MAIAGFETALGCSWTSRSTTAQIVRQSSQIIVMNRFFILTAFEADGQIPTKYP